MSRPSMLLEELRRARNIEPFCPFWIRLTDGRKLRILDPFQIAVWQPDMFVHVNSQGDLDMYEASKILAIESNPHRRPRKRRTG